MQHKKAEDISKAVANMEVYDFLVDIIPKDKYTENFINSSDVGQNDYFQSNKPEIDQE